MLTNLFWKLPQWLKDWAQPKGKTKLTITAHKGKDGEWFFNKFPITWHESLMFPDALDELSGGKNKVTITISTLPLEGLEHKMHIIELDCWDMTASWWHWKDHQIWLCGWLPWFFGEIPETLWFSVK